MARTLTTKDMQRNTAEQLGSVPWTQYVGKALQATNGSFGPNDSRWTQVEEYNWDDDFPDLIWKILGYSVRRDDGGVPTTGIDRTLPKQCPQFPFLFATRITNVQPLGWDRTKTNPTFGTELAGPYVRFNKALLTILYSSLDYDLKDNDAISVGDATLGEQSQIGRAHV